MRAGGKSGGATERPSDGGEEAVEWAVAMGEARETLLRARWVAPMVSDPVENGAVVFTEGRVLGVGSFERMRRLFSGAGVFDAGDSIILPGLVNAHTHLELSQVERPS